jgi:hypothetical protein
MRGNRKIYNKNCSEACRGRVRQSGTTIKLEVLHKSNQE